MFGKKTDQTIEADYECFVVYDSKTKTYNTPHFVMNKDVLVRDVLNMFQDPAQAKNQLFINAEDFSIFRIGYYSKRTGSMTLCSSPEHIVNLHDLRSIAIPPHTDKLVSLPTV